MIEISTRENERIFQTDVAHEKALADQWIAEMCYPNAILPRNVQAIVVSRHYSDSADVNSGTIHIQYFMRNVE